MKSPVIIKSMLTARKLQKVFPKTFGGSGELPTTEPFQKNSRKQGTLSNGWNMCVLAVLRKSGSFLTVNIRLTPESSLPAQN